MNDTLTENGIIPEGDEFETLLEYTDAANDQIKAKFVSLANAGMIPLQSQGFYLPQMLISCRFRGKRCYETDFFYYHDYFYGSCYRFNGGLRDTAQEGSGHVFNASIVRKSSKPGWRNGLRLELYTGKKRHFYKAQITIIISHQ